MTLVLNKDNIKETLLFTFDRVTIDDVNLELKSKFDKSQVTLSLGNNLSLFTFRYYSYATPIEDIMRLPEGLYTYRIYDAMGDLETGAMKLESASYEVVENEGYDGNKYIVYNE